ncbi:MAG TPA: cytochrome c oxidase subunit II [Verrucomicrobiae bacterium]|nr:cytochrome c oxidase subunit II [Verrucomicrobiae bacterium]
MGHWVQLFPAEASTVAGQVDALFFFLVAVSGFFAALIFALIAYFAVKYRRRPGNENPPATKTVMTLEVLWTAIPAGLTVVIFFWGARLFFNIYTPPPNALNVAVVAKQWMWKFQHPEGQREIDELHVPVGQPIKLTMISEDVIHDLFVPAFRVKRDVLPGRYSTVWFQATRPGTYHLFCGQYCGTAHSLMTGWVYVMNPVDYERWLSGEGANEPLAVAGGRLFAQLGCATCHVENDTGRCPSLVGLFGKPVKLRTGETVVANEDYIRESILKPEAKIVAGYQPVMPTFKGVVSEEGVLQLIAYIKSLGNEQGGNKP